ncbi:MAG: hypothetical protein AAFS10_27360 [Myxococcota bacterium]
MRHTASDVDGGDWGGARRDSGGSEQLEVGACDAQRALGRGKLDDSEGEGLGFGGVEVTLGSDLLAVKDHTLLVYWNALFVFYL